MGYNLDELCYLHGHQTRPYPLGEENMLWFSSWFPNFSAWFGHYATRGCGSRWAAEQPASLGVCFQVRKGKLHAVLLELASARECLIPSCHRKTSRKKYVFKIWSSGADIVGLLNFSNNVATLLPESCLLKTGFILYFWLVYFLCWHAPL